MQKFGPIMNIIKLGFVSRKILFLKFKSKKDFDLSNIESDYVAITKFREELEKLDIGELDSQSLRDTLETRREDGIDRFQRSTKPRWAASSFEQPERGNPRVASVLFFTDWFGARPIGWPDNDCWLGRAI